MRKEFERVGVGKRNWGGGGERYPGAFLGRPAHMSNSHVGVVVIRNWAQASGLV